MTELRCLTIRQPWAWAIAAGGKDVENRGWQRSYRGLVAIHAGGQADEDAYDNPLIVAACRRVRPLAGGTAALWHARGAVIAVANLVDICDAWPDLCSCGPWAVTGQLHWRLRDVVLLNEPIPAKGRQGLWWPEPELAERILAGLR